MDYITSQYSVIAHMVTNNLFQVYILRPDGSELLRLNGGWMGSESDFWENKRYAEILVDELNSLLVLPKLPIVIHDEWTPEQHAVEDAKTLNYVLSMLIPTKDETK